jgi:hypothetical protein
MANRSAKHADKAARGTKKAARAKADETEKRTDTGPEGVVGSWVNDTNTEVVSTVCPNGHPSGKGHVATGQLGKATCGQCGAPLVAAHNTAATQAKNKKGGNLISAEESLNMPGVPKHAPDQDFVKQQRAERAKARSGTPKMDTKGGENVTVAREPSA